MLRGNELMENVRYNDNSSKNKKYDDLIRDESKWKTRKHNGGQKGYCLYKLSKFWDFKWLFCAKISAITKKKTYANYFLKF